MAKQQDNYFRTKKEPLISEVTNFERILSSLGVSKSRFIEFSASIRFPIESALSDHISPFEGNFLFWKHQEIEITRIVKKAELCQGFQLQKVH